MTRKSKKTLELIRYYNNYKNKVYSSINLNQWSHHTNNVHSFFLNSFFFEKKLMNKFYKHTKFGKKQIKMWFLFKNRYLKNLTKKLSHYPKTGVLSSHYVHILSRKNMTYQTRSKYRSKTANLNFFNYYFYFFTKFVYTYMYTLQSILYYFSTNSTQKSIWIDEDFYTHTTNWYSNTLNLKKKNYFNIVKRKNFYFMFNINPTILSNKIITELYKNKQQINEFFIEEDVQKKDKIYIDLSSNIDFDTINYIHSVNLFIFSTYTPIYKNTFLYKLISHTNNYVNTYKFK